MYRSVLGPSSRILRSQTYPKRSCGLRRISNQDLGAVACHSVYVSKSTDPFFNLSYEDWLFRHSPPEKPLLFLYRNEPCVVIGRNQNPWKEANIPALRSENVPLIRRRSGGGTVYHDLGNTNFSIHLARRAFDRRTTSQLVLRAVQALGVPNARLNDRNDLCVGDHKMSDFSYRGPPWGDGGSDEDEGKADAGDADRHVSGSAYKIVSARAYHHGTMLISTDLDALGDLLRVDKQKSTMVTKGVASVRSPVCNLQWAMRYSRLEEPVGHGDFVRAVIGEFRRKYGVDAEDDPTQFIDEVRDMKPYIEKGMAELQTWDWIYGQTPEFTYTIEHKFVWGLVIAEVTAKHGIILSCALRVAAARPPASVRAALEQLGKEAEGERYGCWPARQGEDSDGKDAGEGLEEEDAGEVGEVKRWLVEMLN
ncbi:Lipoyltransferase and lipoate-protein ligase [Mycena polygramma]|nr:Lipoyltransferase and lipoate-protein ligase [Mycena polygramma]